jgi:two-component system sensor histidine kinase TctE
MRATPPTLRSQLLRGVLIPLSALLLLGVAASYFVIRSTAQDIYDGELGEIVREMELHVRSTGRATGFDLTPEAERTLLLDRYDRVLFAVRAPDGRTIAGEAGLPAVPAAASGIVFRDAEFEGAGVRVAAIRVVPPGRAEPDAVEIEVAETLVKRRMLARQLLLGVALPQVALILAAAAMVWLGVSRGLAPLQRLREAVAARSHLDISAIDARGAPGEVRPLVLAVNDLMRRFGEVLDFQGRFIADTAHQLRTPVAGLKAHIEVALREEDLTLTRRALAHLYVSADRLAHLVSQLLSLARNEPSTARTASFAALDLNKLVLEATAEWVAAAYRKEIDLGFEGADAPVMVSGDPTRLTELVNNLVDNAIRYTKDGGRVTVRVAGGDRPQLVVSDDGPRIPVEERGRVFERFHRLLGTGAEGSGLGLAIVREIATMHDADIELEDDRDGIGNTFTVRFPGAGPRPQAAPAAQITSL